jgi:hypothetical protein
MEPTLPQTASSTVKNKGRNPMTGKPPLFVSTLASLNATEIKKSQGENIQGIGHTMRRQADVERLLVPADEMTLLTN